MQTLKDHFSLVGTGYLDVLSGRNGPQRVYPNYEAPVIRSLATPAGIVRDIVPMRWGFPAPPFYKIKANVTNVRNTASGYWKPYLKPGQRCLVPATAFSNRTATPASPSSSAGSPGPVASSSISPASGVSGKGTAGPRRYRTSASTCCFRS